MSKELVIGSNRHETKVAILEEDQLVEVFFQRANEYSLAGSIHKGRVTRVLPGMQSAFVDLGLERDTFLYVSDFFEENDDIDTVVEDKPSRNERRDRGQSRQPERSSAVEELPESKPVAIEVAAIEESVGSEEAASSPEQPSIAPEKPENRPADRSDADRGSFRGDRRGRRSRRRRSRGRGFPENKYAQPGAAEIEPTASQVDEVFEVEEESREVIILPGESLAKYRRSEPDETHEDLPEEEPRNFAAGGLEPDPDLENVRPSDLPPRSETEPEAEAEIEKQAEEIELADRVFSHRDESAGEEERKSAEVRHNSPVSPFVVDDIEPEELPLEPTVPSPLTESRSFIETAVIPEPAISSRVIEIPHAPEDPTEFSDSELTGESGLASVAENSSTVSDEPEAGLSAGERAEDEVAEGEPLDVDEFETVEAESEPGSANSSVEATEAAEIAEKPEVQTATVRDQEGRYLHRVSRRMRRRRGGNRFGQQSQGVENGGGSGQGTAAAAQSESRREVAEEHSAERTERVLPSISELLKPGQEIIVQIAKEPLGQKGARITSHIALPGRYVVFMPSVNHLGVSRKIASDEERQRLKRILQAHRVGTTGGFIVRTAGEGVPEDEIAADMNFLYTLWLDIRQKAEKRPAPALLHYDLDIVQRILRDQVTEEFKAIWVDGEDMYENVLSFLQRFQPALVNRVKMYTRSAPIFDAFGITQELEKALRPKVWLKSGGYIVINQTEALVAIDINTGKYVGKSNRLEDTIVKTNTEAVKEIVRQIRLRDLGGIIVVDFIDMDERKNRQKVMQALEDAMRADRAPYKILQFNDFGLVAITRKRVKQSLERTLCSPCPYCEGAGYVKSVQTVISEILTEAQKIARAIEGKDALLRVHPDVAKILKANDNRFLEELEEILSRPVLVKGDAALHHEKFDLG